MFPSPWNLRGWGLPVVPTPINKCPLPTVITTYVVRDTTILDLYILPALSNKSLHISLSIIFVPVFFGMPQI